MSKRKTPPDKQLLDLYINQKKSSEMISREFNVSRTCVCRHLNRLGIIRPESGPNSRNRNFHKKQYRQGYPATFLPDHPRTNFLGYVMDHVLEIEKAIGRCPRRDEPIHHIDLDRQNSNKGNLYLCKSQKDHRQIHNSLFWVAKELLLQGIIKFRDGEYHL